MLLTLVIPVCNEASALTPNLHHIFHIVAQLDIPCEVLVVNDGSTDHSLALLSAFMQQYPNLEVLSLTRNFGKEAAIHAGLEHAAGDAVIVMDSDLQHPPELIERMVKLWQQGLEVVEACKRSRGEETWMQALSAHGFYYLFDKLTGLNLRNHSDFKLLDRKVVDAYCQLPERQRFFRGLIAWMGFSCAQIYFDVPQRQHGQSAWSRLTLLRFSLVALSGFSSLPLHLISLLGVMCISGGLVVGGIALYDKFSGQAVTGFTTVILLILIIGGSIMIALGLIGVYLEHLFSEVKRRPIYLISEKNSLRKSPRARS